MCHKIIIGVLLATALLGQGCSSSACEEEGAGNWRIKMPLVVAPQADSVRLGDTLSIEVRIPFDNINIRDGRPYNVAAAIPRFFGLELSLHNRVGTAIPTIEGVSNFNVIAITGTVSDFNDVGKACTFVPMSDAFVFKAKLIPQKRGLVSIALSQATADPGVRCAVVTYIPECTNTNRNHLLYQQLHQVFTDYIPESKFFIWVR
jgi:hypothetical protein